MRIEFKNFRVFAENVSFDFPVFSILTGPNNSGKSTIQNALTIIKNSFFANDKQSIEKLSFSDIDKKLGGFTENITFGSQKNEVNIIFKYFSNLYQKNISFHTTYVKQEINNDGVLQELMVAFESQAGDFLEPLFEISKVNKVWMLTKFNFNLFRKILLDLKENGKKQNNLLRIKDKLKNKKELSNKEKEIYKLLKEEGFEINLKDYEYDYKYCNHPGWGDFTKNGERIPFNYYYDKAVESFSSINGLILDSFFLQSYNGDDEKLKAKIIDYLKNEKIISFSELKDYLVDIEDKIFHLVIQNINETSAGYYQIDEHLNQEPDILLDSFFKYCVKDAGSNFSWYYSGKELLENDSLLSFIFEIDPGLSREKRGGVAIDVNGLYNNPTIEKYKKEEKILIKKTASVAFYYLVVLWGEFQEELKGFIRKTHLLLFSTEIKRHLFFNDKKNKFQKILSDYAKNSFEGKITNVQKEYISKWLREFDIASKLIIKRIKVGNELIGAEFYLQKKNKEIPLGNNGVGTNQLLVLILQLAINNDTRFVLEEPEVNLHPAFQSKLAEFFMDAYKTFGHTFIIETHSEYLIRKLQYLTLKKELKAEDTKIYYFYHPNKVPNGEEQIKEINIEEDGSLSDDFGPGFFDEATNIKFELMRLKNSQKN